MKLKSIFPGILCLSFAGCCQQKPASCHTAAKPVSAAVTSWKEELQKDLPLLGHRNWIVVTDMAYPLQTQPGIKTIYTDAPYMEILEFVYKEIEKAPHVKPVIYQDKELSFLEEKDVKGVDELRSRMKTIFGNQVIPTKHDDLIARLDEVSRMFNVVVLKSNLTMAYTSTFFELDCRYWESSKEKALRDKMK